MRRASPRFAVGTRRPRRTPAQARAAPCTARASQRPRRCKPSSRSSRSSVERRASGCGAGAEGFPPVPHQSSVRAHRSSITQTLAFDPRRAALHFRPPVLQRAESRASWRPCPQRKCSWACLAKLAVAGAIGRRTGRWEAGRRAMSACHERLRRPRRCGRLGSCVPRRDRRVRAVLGSAV